MKSEFILSELDYQILESYRQIIHGLGEYLGSAYEIILHNLGSYDHSVIAIENGHYTGRKVGAPITNMALDMLESIRNNNSGDNISYFTTSKNGKPMKSTTIAIRGEKQRVIGLLCINFYMDIPFSSLLKDFTTNAISQEQTLETSISSTNVTEEFHENSTDLILNIITSSKEQILQDNTISSTNKNKAIIQLLYDKGVFNFKDSVILVAENLHISKNTVYLHLRNIKE